MFKAKALAAGISAAAFSLAISSAASASTVDLAFEGLDISTDAEVISFAVESTEGNRATGARAGAFQMRVLGDADTFLAWCVDLLQNVGSGEYTMARPVQVSDANQANLESLFNTHRDGAQMTALSAAAFQVAIWEIVYEDDDAFDVNEGAFKLTSHTGVNAAAQNLLNTLSATATPADGGTYQLSFFTSSEKQDLVVANVVPLPASALLLLAGLGGLAAARRRQS